MVYDSIILSMVFKIINILKRNGNICKPGHFLLIFLTKPNAFFALTCYIQGTSLKVSASIWKKGNIKKC